MSALKKDFAFSLSPAARLALRAVLLRKTCGAYAARRFALKNGSEVLSLYRLALQLEAAKDFV